MNCSEVHAVDISLVGLNIEMVPGAVKPCPAPSSGLSYKKYLLAFSLAFPGVAVDCGLHLPLLNVSTFPLSFLRENFNVHYPKN